MSISAKRFRYDVLIDAEDFCNRKAEQRELIKRAKLKKHTIVFAPRRYGKTSLVKNIVGKDFYRASRKHLVLFFDLMGVRSFESIAKRMHFGISRSLSARFPVKTLIKEVASSLKGFSLQMDIDPISGLPLVTLSPKGKEPRTEINSMFDLIKKVAADYPTMVVLDEFPDIHFVPEADALFRGFLQELGGSSVFILGSKRHLLSLMFQDAHAPLFQYGDEFQLDPIPAVDWLAYFQERMAEKKIEIESEVMNWILETLCDVPNAVCEFGAWLVDSVPVGTKLALGPTKQKLDQLVEKKQSYAFLLQGFSEREIEVMSALAKKGFTLEPYSEVFLKLIPVAKSSVGKIIKKLMNRGFVEFETHKGYRLSDPLLSHYLARGG